MVEVSFKGLELVQKIGQQYPIVARRALKETARQTRTEAKKLLLERYNIKSGDLNKALGNPVQVSEDAIALRASGKRLPLIYFNPSKTGQGLDVMVRYGTGTKTIASAFIATMKSGHKGAFLRTTSKRLPIKEQYRLSIAEMFGGSKIMNRLMKFAFDNMERITISKLKDYLKIK